ncbi:MAG: hypothetical protein PHN72_06075 [Bacilli bacterium]|nr:hypothetical protein [Bacilli bacterium]
MSRDEYFQEIADYYISLLGTEPTMTAYVEGNPQMLYQAAMDKGIDPEAIHQNLENTSYAVHSNFDVQNIRNSQKKLMNETIEVLSNEEIYRQAERSKYYAKYGMDEGNPEMRAVFAEMYEFYQREAENRQMQETQSIQR